MIRGKQRKPAKKAIFSIEEDSEQTKLAAELAELAKEPTELTGEPAKLKKEPSKLAGETSPSSRNEEEIQQIIQSMAHLETILQEIRDFRCENPEILKEIKNDISKANSRINDAEKRIVESEERIQNIEDTTLEFLELQKQFETRLTDQEGRLRRENIRIHGVKEGAEENAQSMIIFTETLLQEKLELPPFFELKIDLVSRPPKDSPPRSIVVKLLSF